MKLTFLGTGTSTGVPYIGCDCEVCKSKDPRDQRLRCSSLLEINDKKILIDCGPDFRQQALRSNIRHIDAVLLTHEHVDHMMGLDDLRPFGNVDIYANESTTVAIHRVFSYCFNNNYHGIPSFSMHEISNHPFQIGETVIQPVIAYHFKLPIYGYRIGNFAYLTDFKTIDPCEEEKLKGLDVLILNALRHTEHFSHASVEESLALVNRVKPKRTYFIHMCHQIGLHEMEDAKLPENVHLAYDGLTIEF